MPLCPCWFVGLILMGICFGTFMGVFPGFCTDQFGSRHNIGELRYHVDWFRIAWHRGSHYPHPGVRLRRHVSHGVPDCHGNRHPGLLMTFIYRSVVKKMA